MSPGALVQRGNDTSSVPGSAKPQHCCVRFVCVFVDETLDEACQWLIAAGFPQYIQLLLGKHVCF